MIFSHSESGRTIGTFGDVVIHQTTCEIPFPYFCNIRNISLQLSRSDFGFSSLLNHSMLDSCNCLDLLPSSYNSLSSSETQCLLVFPRGDLVMEWSLKGTTFSSRASKLQQHKGPIWAWRPNSLIFAFASASELCDLSELFNILLKSLLFRGCILFCGEGEGENNFGDGVRFRNLSGGEVIDCIVDTGDDSFWV